MSSIYSAKYDLGVDLFLGKIPEDLSRLANDVSLKSKQKTSRNQTGSVIEVRLDGDWFDISMLSYFTAVLIEASKIFYKIELKMPGIVNKDKKISFLWKVGFWSLIQADYEDSPITCYPNPWKYRPEEINKLSVQKRFNYTEMMFDKPLESDSIINSWEEKISQTKCYSFIKDTGIFLKQDYLAIIIQELAYNAKEHSGGNLLSFAGQLFLSKNDIGCDIGKLKDVLYAQHYSEIANSKLHSRKKWLECNKDKSFLLISCLDTGVGISTSLMNSDDFKNEYMDDIIKTNTSPEQFALDKAFEPMVSLKEYELKNVSQEDFEAENEEIELPPLFDVHGLSMVESLVDRYNGYLFVSSSSAYLEYSGGKRVTGTLDNTISGTIFQILLPIDNADLKSLVFQKKHIKMLGGDGTDIESFMLSEFISESKFSKNSNRGISIWDNKKRWKEFAYYLYEHVKDRYQNRVLYLDLLCIPPHRQFLSFILRSLRMINSGRQSIVVINASVKLLSLLGYMSLLDSQGFEEDFKLFEGFEKNLVSAISRGRKKDKFIPMLLPIVASHTGKGDTIIWAGLKLLDSSKQDLLLKLLEYMWHQSVGINKDDIENMIVTVDQNIDKEKMVSWAMSVFSVNDALFVSNDYGVELIFTLKDTHDLSFDTLLKKFKTDIVSEMEWKNPKRDWLFRMGWRAKKEKCYRQKYYSSWRALSNTLSLNISTRLLLSKFTSEYPEIINEIDAIVSVTPSAGQLGREISRVLGADYFEIPSVYDIDDDFGISEIRNSKIAVVDDVIDSGTLTKAIFEKIENKNGNKVITIFALLKNTDEQSDFDWMFNDLSTRSCVLHGVSLGEPSLDEINKAEKDDKYYMIDPYTLEPIKPDMLAFEEKYRDPLDAFCSKGTIKVGHFKQNSHHYNIYFSLPNAIEDFELRGRIIAWLVRSVENWSGFNKKSDKLTVIIPHYSNIGMLIHPLKNQFFDNNFNHVECKIAKPVTMPGERISYRIPEIDDTCDHVVFLDDCMATSETISAIQNELVAKRRSLSFLALILFERIDSHRACFRDNDLHIRNPSSQTNNGNTAFIQLNFRSLIRINLRTYNRYNCQLCKIHSKIEAMNIFLERPSKSVLSQFTPIHLCYSRKIQPSWLTPQDTFKLLVFQHEVLGQLPTLSYVHNKLKENSSIVNLECITFLLTDKRLCKQITKDELKNVIKACLSDPTVSSDRRAYFIFQITSWYDDTLAFETLSEWLPDIYGNSFDNISNHFKDNYQEFIAIAFVYSNLKGNIDYISVLAKWKQVLESDPSAESPFFVILMAIVPGIEHALVRARSLIRSFLGSFAEHEESLKRKIRYLRNYTLSSLPDRVDRAAEHLDESAFVQLLEHIGSIERFYSVAYFSLSTTVNDFMIAFKKWQDGDERELLKIIEDNFLSSKGNTPKIYKLLNIISPSAQEVFFDAFNKLSSDIQQGLEDIKLDWENSSYGSTFYLIGKRSCLAEALKNIIENAWEITKKHSGDVSKIKVQCQQARDETLKLFEFRVHDGEVSVPDRLDSGGYSEYQGLLKIWGGEISCEDINKDEIRKAVVMRIPGIKNLKKTL